MRLVDSSDYSAPAEKADYKADGHWTNAPGRDSGSVPKLLRIRVLDAMRIADTVRGTSATARASSCQSINRLMAALVLALLVSLAPVSTVSGDDGGPQTEGDPGALFATDATQLGTNTPADQSSQVAPSQLTVPVPELPLPASHELPACLSPCLPCCSDLLDDAPNMIGGVFGAGTGSINFANIPQKQVTSIQIPNPAESLFGRLTIADDSSPLPRDRLFVDYDYFNDVPFSPYGANTSRVTTGVEKTFFDGLLSAEVRIPFGTTPTDDLVMRPVSVKSGPIPWNYPGGIEALLGDVTIGAKVLLIRRRNELAVSAGLLMTVPTASDERVAGLLAPLGTASASLRFKNEAVHLAPYLGALWTPTDRLFVQGFLQFDVDANGQPVVLENSASSVDLGRFRDQSFVYCDTSIGYWFVHEEPLSVAGLFEVHYDTSLQSADSLVVVPGEVTLGGGQGNGNQIDLVFGATVQYNKDKRFMLAYVLPVGSHNDEQFNRELRVSFNWCF
jgi:hypothetical protein